MSQHYPDPNPGPLTPRKPVRRLTRTPDEQMIAGVCGGLALYLNLDPTLVRVAAVVALFFGFPAVAIGYLVAWAIVPQG